MENLKPSQIVIMASGVVAFLVSFMEMAEDSGSAWEDFGLTSFPALFGLLAAGIIAAAAFVNVQLPERIATLRLNQIILILGLTATLIMIGFWRLADAGEADLSVGFWLYFLGSIGLLVGAVMDITAGGSDTAAAPSSTPPTPF